MHGTVLIDAHRKSLGPAIVWADQRSVVEVDECAALIGPERLARICGTTPTTGCIAPTLLWLKTRTPKIEVRLGKTRGVVDLILLKVG